RPASLHHHHSFPTRRSSDLGLRPGDDKWADSVVALRAKTGEIAWGFQLVHHNLWDYDTASPPLLATLPHNGQKIPVVIQSNKTGDRKSTRLNSSHGSISYAV